METAIAIVVAAGVFIAVFIDQKKKDRASRLDGARHIAASAARSLDELKTELHGANEQLLDLKGYVRESNRALAPLCKSLAESLQAQMSTIDREMADLRTRVETGPGKRTLRV